MILLNVLLIISPIFLLILLGFFCRRFGLISIQASKEINKFIFYISLPALLMSKISQIDVKIADQWNAYYSILLATAIVALLSIFLSGFLGLLESQKWVCVHGAVRSNMAFIGLPVIFYANNGNGMSIAALLMGLTIPVYNILGVIFLTLGKKNVQKVSLKEFLVKVLVSIAKNPLIIGCLLGGFLYCLKIEKTSYLIKNLDLLGAISLPLPLICMGVQMNTAISWLRIKQVFFPTILKLIVCPVLGLMFLLLFYNHADPQLMLTVMILLGCPSAVASYVMAIEMNADHEFAADTVLVTTLFSFFSLSGILFYFQLV